MHEMNDSGSFIFLNKKDYIYILLCKYGIDDVKYISN